MTYDISIIGTVGLPARYGGFETLTEQLVRRWKGQLRTQVFCTEVGASPTPPSTHEGADLRYLRWDANGWQSIPYDIISMWRAASTSRTLLVLGVSGCIALPLIRLRWRQLRIVAHIDGLEWRRRKWGRAARLFLRLSEWFAVRFSHAVIADNQAIVEHVRRAYGCSASLIAYGGDHVLTGAVTVPLPETRFQPADYFISVCRIEPENNIREILAAFTASPANNLVIVGNWRISPYAERLKDEFGSAANIELKDPVYDIGLLESLRRHAKAYVHGHSAGGTNPSLVEAMTLGLPVLAYDVDYNRHTTADLATYWNSAQALALMLSSLSPSELAKQGRLLREAASLRYSWGSVASQYRQLLLPTNSPN